MLGLRANIIDFRKRDGRDAATVTVRAVNKVGAVATARFFTASLIPIWEQNVVSVENLSNDRTFDKWKITIEDIESVDRI